jgi:hypothetical protein
VAVIVTNFIFGPFVSWPAGRPGKFISADDEHEQQRQHKHPVPRATSARPYPSRSRAIVSKFPVNSVAGVFYHPERHKKSVLLPGANKYTYFGLMVAPASWFGR